MAESAAVMAGAGALVLLGVLASKVSDRLGVPALLLFLGIGILAGSEGPGGIEFDDAELARDVGVVALAYILFSGGLSTEWRSVRPVLREGLLLATVGVASTAVTVGLLASWMLDVPTTTGLLLGSIVSSTDAAAVFSVLRSRHASLRGTLRPLLELESGSNDPMAVFLTVAFLELVAEPGTSLLEFVPLFLAQAVVGGAVGYASARLAVAAINRIRLGYDGLYTVLLLSIVALTYALATLAGGSGFLAVYVAGIGIGNARFIHQKSLVRFMDGVAWLMQITMFLVLGLLVFPSELWEVAPEALAISAALIVVGRPIATALVLVPARFGRRETAMVAWVGLRGAVPVILATFPLVEGVPHDHLLFNVVFFIVITSVLLQGTTIPVVARWLRVDAPLPPSRTAPLELIEPAGGADLHEVTIPPGAAADGRQLLDLHLPEGTLAVLISRAGEHLVPQGSTVVEAGDTVLLLTDEHGLAAAREALTGAG